MRTWKTTLVLALAALFVVGASAASAIAAGLVIAPPQAASTAVESHEAPPSTPRHASAAIPELDAKPTPVAPVIPEAEHPVRHEEPGEPELYQGGGIGTVEEIGQFLGGDPCPGCGRG